MAQTKLTQFGSKSSEGRIIKTEFAVIQTGSTGFYVDRDLSNTVREISTARNRRKQTQ